MTRPDLTAITTRADVPALLEYIAYLEARLELIDSTPIPIYVICEGCGKQMIQSRPNQKAHNATCRKRAKRRKEAAIK